MREIGIRSGLILIIIVGYFVLLRPARGLINEAVYQPVAEYVVQAQPGFSFAGDAKTVSNHLLIEEAIGIEEIYFTVSFGLHFLLACIGLIMIKAERKYYGYLILIQLATGLLSIVFLAFTNLISLQFISLTDFTIRYLNPLCSLGLVPLAFTLQKRTVNEQRS